MNALVKNKCEAEFLAVANEVAEILGVQLVWESQALEEGGIREIWAAIGSNNSQIAIIISVLALIWSVVPQTDQELVDLQKEETRLSIQEKRLEIEKLKKELKKESPSKEALKSASKIANDSYKVVTRRSNFYKSISGCEKVYQIGFSSLDIENRNLENERIVESSDFIKFVVTSNELKPLEIKSARIEIVSPVLKEGKAKWKGIYEGNNISFTMDDREFRSAVLSRKISFKNGSEIVCALLIHKKIDELGDVITSGYSVDVVIENIESGLPKETPQGKRYRHTQKLLEAQKDLFGDENP
tara:strand:- start:9280 stop:10179 length:900 start_codon:yes stop_codon:yes gene_type:complete